MWKMKLLLEIEGHLHLPQCLVAGDATASRPMLLCSKFHVRARAISADGADIPVAF